MKNKSRVRLFVIFIVGAVLASRSSMAQDQVRNYEIDDLINVVRISDRVIVVRTGIDFFDAVTAIATEKGIVMLDAGFTPQMTERYKKIIAKALGRNDFKYLINTHSHWDHTYGNQAFPGATIIGHENCKAEMTKVAEDGDRSLESFKRYINSRTEKFKSLDANSDAGKQEYKELTTGSMVLEDLQNKTFKLTPPSLSFTDKLTLFLGDVTFELVYFGNAHTESDILVYVPEEKILFTGDLFFSGGQCGGWTTKMNRENLDRWYDVLSGFLVPEKEIKTVIHGHGMLLTKNDLEIALSQTIAKYRDMYNNGKELYRSAIMAEKLEKEGMDAAREEFKKLRKAGKDKYFFIESGFKNLAYQLLQQNKTNEAVEIFKMNVELFPESWDAYDSLGEAYMKDGQNGPSIVNYEKSLLLNPKNDNGRDILAVLKKAAGPAAGGPNLLKGPESIIYDRAHQRYLLSNYETGNIIQVDGAGKQAILVENMVAIQGLEIVGNVVYVGARNSVRGFDLETGKMVMNVPVEGVSNLNDITADDAGNLYAGDVFGTKIIKVRIKDSSYSVFVDGNGIDHPNGIFFDKAKNRILVCSYRKKSPIQAISLADASVTTLADTNIDECDGIVLDKYGRCYVTSWETLSIYRFDRDFSDPPAVFYKSSCGPADIAYDSVHDAIAIPLMKCNSYEIVPVDPPQGK
jgi:glyoxylase-like metal-dependent hydrolase (beta-lactamase superfamily II)